MENKDLNTIMTLEELSSYKKKLDEAFDRRREELSLLDEGINISNKDFGYLKECFESLVPSLFESENGRSLINKYVAMIKESETLSSLHAIYEGIRKSGKNTDADFLINTILSENTINKSKVAGESKKLGLVVAEAFVYLGSDANDLLPSENSKLYESVKYITENKKKLNNLSNFANAVSTIKEEIAQHEEVKVNEVKNLDNMLKNMVSEFNEKYSDLTDKEKSIVKELAESSDKESVFNKYKNLCIEKIKESKDTFEKSGDAESATKMGKIFEQVSNKSYIEDSIENDLKNFLELTDIL